MLKKYQPERTDLLINTDWGIPSDRLSEEAVQNRSLKLFHHQWVTKEEKKQLREEYGTYHSIRIIGYLIIFMALIILINIGGIFKGGLLSTALAALYGFLMLLAGIGLIGFRLFARNIAVSVFLSFLILPFTPLLMDDKGAPLIVILGIIGLYYLLRRTARKIFSPFSVGHSDPAQHKSSSVRKAIYAVLSVLLLFVMYTLYDLKQAKQTASAICNQAVTGMPVKDFMSNIPQKDYMIVRRDKQIIIVPKRGMGRNHCTVFHDGKKITGSKTGFND